jgi:hypothetical protein
LGGVLVALRAQVPAPAARGFELAVAAMLVLLGVDALRRARLRTRGAACSAPSPPGARRPLFVGLIHGLAGTGALAVATLSAFAQPAQGLAFLIVYAVGALLGMTALAGLLGIPLARLARGRRGAVGLLLLTGAFSILVGVAWASAVLRA